MGEVVIVQSNTCTVERRRLSLHRHICTFNNFIELFQVSDTETVLYFKASALSNNKIHDIKWIRSNCPLCACKRESLDLVLLIWNRSATY